MYSSIAGASKVRRMNGSRPSVILCLSGNWSAGLRRRDRLVLVLDLLLISVKEKRKAYCYRQQFPRAKAVRAQSIRGRMALEGLYVSTNAAWFAEFKRELLSFPAASTMTTLMHLV
jgi:hypothetical protein